MLDSVMITAVKDMVFSVDEFIHYVKTDTTFIKGLKILDITITISIVS